MHRFYLLILIFLTNNIFANVALKDIVLSDSLMHQIVSISSNNTDENEITKQLSQIYAKEWKAISNENRTAILSLLHIQHDSIFTNNDSSYNRCIILADSFLLSKQFDFANKKQIYSYIFYFIAA